MSKAEETKIAWFVWNLLQQVADHLWERYEDGFLDRCMEHDEVEAERTEAVANQRFSNEGSPHADLETDMR